MHHRKLAFDLDALSSGELGIEALRPLGQVHLARDQRGEPRGGRTR